MAAKAKIGVLGASGYTGGELVRVLLRHPRAEIVLLTAERSAGKAMRDVFPQFSPFTLPQLVAIDGLDWKSAALDRKSDFGLTNRMNSPLAPNRSPAASSPEHAESRLIRSPGAPNGNQRKARASTT